MRTRLSAYEVTECSSAAELVSSSDKIFSLVTADQALAAAQSVAECDLSGRFYFDCNSCAPQTKKKAARLIEAAGGNYIDVAVMAPVHPKLHHVPLSLSAPKAEEAASILSNLDMKPTVSGDAVGYASAMKLTRSIAVKGLEALSAELLLVASELGIQDEVIASLDKSYPGFDWEKRGNYAFDRMMIHGKRRSAEMAEAAEMIKQLRLSSEMTNATVQWQKAISELGEAPKEEELSEITARILKALSSRS